MRSGRAPIPPVRGIYVPLITEDLPCSPELRAICRRRRTGSWDLGSPRGCRCSGRCGLTPRLPRAGGRGLRALRPARSPSPAFRLGCGLLGAAGSPALPLRGVLCPLVRCLLLSLARGWQPLLRLVACGAAVARAVGSGACQSPSAAPLVPRSPLTPPLPGGLTSTSQTVNWV